MSAPRLLARAALAVVLVACDEPASPASVSTCVGADTDAPTAGCLRPTLPPEHYVAQALLYFDTLDTSADPARVPTYAPWVARWEWPPWLLLTGWGREVMVNTATALRQIDPSTVPERDCRFFETQPFARCYVVFDYAGGRCPIYEEFVFNDAGEMTFIEAWSDVDGLRPTSARDPFGEAPDFPRLSTRVPGLGRSDGLVDPDSPALIAAAEADPDLASFRTRALDFWGTWGAEYRAAPPDFFARGCGWGAEP